MKHSARRVVAGVCLLLLPAGCAKEPANRADASRAATAPIAIEADAAKPDAPLALEEGTARSAILRRWTGDLDGMVARRVIRVLTTYSKTNYFVDGGTQRGLVYDSVRMFEDDLNKKLKTRNVRVHLVMVPVARDELIPALLEGRGDVVAAGTMINDARLKQVDFTTPTRTGVSVVVVTAPGAPPVTRVEDLAGREIYLQTSMVAPQAVERFNADLAGKRLPPVKIRPAPEVLADEDILEMVNAGLVPTTLTFDYVAEFWQQVFPKLVINRGAVLKTDGQIAMMVRKNSPQLKGELNAFIARYPEGSPQRNALLRNYLENVRYAKAATSKGAQAKMDRTLAIFRKYGEQYGLDYLLMLAQGYQESQLDQSARNQSGAMGVMQVMPATGREMKVGDISQLDPNIHAGVKYIHFMMDTYYANEPMDRINKGLFTFASYNAGPGRVSSLRRKAAARGLDPNKWFNNVEIVAAESIGRETVQYVSNIYKYYLAYQMLMENRVQRAKAKQAEAGRK